jgi:hypothetical protein
MIGKNKIRDSLNPHSEPDQWQKQSFVDTATKDELYENVKECHFTSITNNFFHSLGLQIGNIESKGQNRDPYSGRIACLQFALNTELSYACLPRCDRERSEFNSMYAAYMKLFDDVMSSCIRDESGENLLKLVLKNISESHDTAHYSEKRDISQLTKGGPLENDQRGIKLPIPGRSKT